MEEGEPPELAKELGEAKNLPHCLRQCHIFCLCCGQCNFCLQLGSLDQGKIGICDEISRSGNYRGRFIVAFRAPRRSKTGINIYLDAFYVIRLVD